MAPSSLMGSPAEIRNMIFKELLIMPSPVFFEDIIRYEVHNDEQLLRSSPPVATSQTLILVTNNEEYTTTSGVWQCVDYDQSCTIKQSMVLDLFLTSKTVYREAAPIYFGNNVFQFEYLDRFESFLRTIGTESRWQLSRLKVTWSSKDSYTGGRVAMLLRQCPALRELTLKLCHSSIAKEDKWSPYKIQLFGMRNLLNLRGLTKIDIFIPTVPYCHLWMCHHIRRGHRFHHTYSVGLPASPQDVEIMIERLQVTKKPRDEKELRRLTRKDGLEQAAKGEASAGK